MCLKKNKIQAKIDAIIESNVCRTTALVTCSPDEPAGSIKAGDGDATGQGLI